MNMNPEQEKFEPLRRLLAVKRHEQPPPGYFDNFARQVIIRIRAGEGPGSSSILEAFSWQAPWLQRLLGAFQGRPILAGGFGFAACALLLAGFLFSENASAPPELFGSTLATTALPQWQLHPDVVSTALGQPSVQVEPVADLIPTGPRNDSLFQQLKELHAPQRAMLINSTVPAPFAP